MGNDEAIIYGDRHGEQYREDGDKTESVVWRTYYPNAIKLNSIGGHEVSLGVITFDPETGERNVTTYADDGQPIQWDSLWTSLDRQGVNRLIRELRSMRDRVFGKDE